jgi:hypothetical protein
LSVPTSGRAAKASLVTPLKAMPASPAWPSAFASLATPLKAMPASPAWPSACARASVCVANLERVPESRE